MVGGYWRGPNYRVPLSVIEQELERELEAALNAELDAQDAE
jgi:hypothetical protein